MVFKVSMVFTAFDKVTSTMDKMTNSSKRFEKSTTQAFKNAGKSAGFFGKMLAANLSAQAIISFARRATNALQNLTFGLIKQADELGKFAKQVGIGVKTLQELQYAGERAGLGAGVMDKVLQNLNKNIGELRMGTGTLTSYMRVMNKYGLAMQIKNSKSLEEQFFTIIDTMKKMTNQSDRTALAMAAFGKSGMEVVKIVDSGSEGIKQLMKRFEQLGGGISEDGVKAAAEFMAVWQDLNMLAKGFAFSIIGRYIPAIRDAGKEFFSFLQTNREFIASGIHKSIETATTLFKEFAPYIKMVAWALYQSAQFLYQNREIIIPLIKWWIYYKTVMMAVTAIQWLYNASVLATYRGMWSMVLMVAKVGKVFLFLGKVIRGVMILLRTIGAFTPLGAFIIAATLIYMYWEPLSEFFIKLWDQIKSIFSGGSEWILGIITKVADFLTGFISKSIAKFKSFVTSIRTLGGLLGDGASMTVNGQPDQMAQGQGPLFQAPNQAQAQLQRQRVDFNGLLQISGAPSGSSVQSETRGAAPISLRLLGES